MDDEEVRTAFANARDDDARDLPSFESVIQRSSRAAAWRATPRAWLVAAGVLIAVGAATYGVIQRQQDRLTVPSEVVALSAWRPATDVLLAMPTDLLRAAPVMGTSILDPIPGRDTSSTGAFR